MAKFSLSDHFLEQYKNKKPEFGFNGLGELVYKRTYSRTKEDGTKEEWWETVKRVVEGTYNMQKKHVDFYKLGWNPWKAQSSAQEMYERIFSFKFLPPGRGLWAMGTSLTEERELYACLNNCGYASTQHIDKEDPTKPFCFLFDMSMLGAGIGFDLRGDGKIQIKAPDINKQITYVIPDSREGWVESLRLLLHSYFAGKEKVIFDYSEVRAKGEPIKGFGGVSSGSGPLKELHEFCRETLDAAVDGPLTGRIITDIMNKIGTCVVAGNVRRSSEIVFGDYDDEEYLNLKNYEVNPDRISLGWASNNSVFADVGMDYTKIVPRIVDNGEPGFMWLKHAQDYGRMSEEPNYKDYRVMGGNPCVTGDTLLLTSKGHYSIKDTVGQEIEIWNGEEWSTVVPFSTGENSITVVELSDGTVLEVTPYHEFILREGWTERGRVFRKKAADLVIGDKLEKYDMPVLTEGVSYPVDAYSQGFYSGDGTADYTHSFLYQPKYCCEERLIGSFSKQYEGKRKQWTHGTMLDKRFVPINGTMAYCLDWLAGLFDADGTVTRDKHGNGLQLSSTDKSFLLNVKVLLTRLGVRAKVVDGPEEGYYQLPDGNGGTKEYFCKKLNRILIGNSDVYKLVQLGINFSRLSVHSDPPQRDARRFVTVSNIMVTDRVEETFCFTEPKKNRGTFNGTVLGQCLEQSLESYEMCCLVESFPHRHDSMEDYLKTIKYAYLYAKTITLGTIHWVETNRIQMRNRRIGCSVSGVAQFITDHGVEELRTWLDSGYNEVQRLDKEYSDWLAIPRSIKTTSVKPSGTVSLLAGATPGAHFPIAQHYIRRMRLAANSELLPKLEEAGYKVESCFGQEETTVVVEFPVCVGENIRTLDDVSMWEQLSVAAMLQEWWADNQVSCTVTFDRDTEGPQLASALDFFQYKLKGISFLPNDKKTYPQMPYEKITKEEYEDMLNNLTEIDFSEERSEATPDRFCDGDKCVV